MYELGQELKITKKIWNISILGQIQAGSGSDTNLSGSPTLSRTEDAFPFIPTHPLEPRWIVGQIAAS